MLAPLPSNREKNPRKHVNAISLTCIRGLYGDEIVREGEKPEDSMEKYEESEKRVVETFKPKISYPVALTKNRSEDEMRKFVEIFKR